MALWRYKSMLCLQANSCHLKSRRAWAISLTLGLRREQKCAAIPGRLPRCGGWQKSMWNRALTWICTQHVLTDGRRLDQLKLNLLGSPLKDCPSILMSFRRINFLTTLSDGDVSRWKLYIAWCQGMFLKWLTLCFNRTELNAPLPPLAAHVATPDGTHQESMRKTDQPPCQLMRPRRINNRVETDTYFSLYWL